MLVKSLVSEKKSDEIELYPFMRLLPCSNKSVSIFSWNTLYKEWVTNDRYPYVNDEYRTWKYRLPIIRNTITTYNADIICLQEIDIEPVAFRDDFGDYFNDLGYNTILPPVIIQKMNESKFPWSGHWGNAILYNKKKYKCVHQEALNRNSRIMICLFVDLESIKHCKYCNMHNIICIYHSFFVINIHLTGHPQKHIVRLNEIRKIIEKLDIFGGIFKTKKHKLQKMGFDSNINGKKQNMRIILCGDFNSPKTGLVDKLIINKKIDYDKIKINKVSEQGLYLNDLDTNSLKTKSIRFIFNSKDIGGLIGHRGSFINKLRNISKAKIIIPAVTSNIKTRIVIVNGEYNNILKAISMITYRIKRSSLLMCIEEKNIKCLNLPQIYNMSYAKMYISSKTLFNSTEKTIDISGDKQAIYLTIKLIIKQLFQSKSYIITRMEYMPSAAIQINNIFTHKYQFNDSYHDGLISKYKNNHHHNNDDYFDRLQYFPTYGDGRIVAAMDFIYFTSNNIKLIGITKTLNHNDEMMDKLKIEIDKKRKKENINNSDYTHCREQGILSNLWCLPNDKIISDHTPIAAIFILDDICNKSNKQKCDCYIENTTDNKI